MEKIPEINIKTQTKPIGGIGIEDMKKMFGKRIEKAIYTSEVNKNGRCYTALIGKEMAKICKWWKFWNRDIAKAYKNYQGMILAPYIIQMDNTITLSHSANIPLPKRMRDAYSRANANEDNKI